MVLAAWKLTLEPQLGSILTLGLYVLVFKDRCPADSCTSLRVFVNHGRISFPFSMAKYIYYYPVAQHALFHSYRTELAGSDVLWSRLGRKGIFVRDVREGCRGELDGN